MRPASFTTTILEDQLDDGTDLELEVTVWFSIGPAEPDVGIMSEYAEDVTVSADFGPLGEILFEAHERYEDQITEAAHVAVDDHRDYFNL